MKPGSHLKAVSELLEKRKAASEQQPAEQSSEPVEVRKSTVVNKYYLGVVNAIFIPRPQSRGARSVHPCFFFGRYF